MSRNKRNAKCDAICDAKYDAKCDMRSAKCDAKCDNEDTAEKRLRMRETRGKLTIKFISQAYMHYKMMNIKTKPQNLRSKTSGIARRRLELLFYVG